MFKCFKKMLRLDFRKPFRAWHSALSEIFLRMQLKFQLRDQKFQQCTIFILYVSHVFWNPYPSLVLGAFHTTDLDVSMLSTRNNLYTFKVICQYNNVAPRAICLKEIGQKQKNIDRYAIIIEKQNKTLENNVLNKLTFIFHSSFKEHKYILLH